MTMMRLANSTRPSIGTPYYLELVVCHGIVQRLQFFASSRRSFRRLTAARRPSGRGSPPPHLARLCCSLFFLYAAMAESLPGVLRTVAPHSYTPLFAFGLAFAAADAFGIGSNDVANRCVHVNYCCFVHLSAALLTPTRSFATSVGSRSLSLRAACVIASVTELFGAAVLGGTVTAGIKGASAVSDAAAACTRSAAEPAAAPPGAARRLANTLADGIIGTDRFAGQVDVLMVRLRKNIQSAAQHHARARRAAPRGTADRPRARAARRAFLATPAGLLPPSYAHATERAPSTARYALLARRLLLLGKHGQPAWPRSLHLARYRCAREPSLRSAPERRGASRSHHGRGVLVRWLLLHPVGFV